ncbi:hypothetical protein HYH03_015930 [Edaphochlamys debaryana]|uniref:ATP-dependent DNA helicase n=1 Tax=Edaphochlamys debaryana TaxID=47281 RepID=A0A836BRZ8_9CHLO|nr:hypothetical protein HYH03_015930 [Edaphochlamys debaryana]|eukprot:KAG2485349.1 hypothetical protein HYH03_015930 [Edaphochlamys debaryana]
MTALDPIQERVVDRVCAGRSVVFTGSAGTGKTFLLNVILQRLREKYGEDEFKDRVAVTAMTGIAATHIQGTTFNAVIGLRVPTTYANFMCMLRKDNVTRICRLDMLVVDECSMMSAELFELFVFMMAMIRRKSQPAGDLQLVFSGDFFQMPPVCKQQQLSKDIDANAFTNFGYAFQAPSWPLVFQREDHIMLTNIFRQADACFAAQLNTIRVGTADAIATLADLVAACSRPVECADGIKPTQVYARNADVDRVNTAELLALPGEPVTYAAIDEVVLRSALTSNNSSTSNNVSAKDHFKDCMASASLQLKVGAQVMLLKNLDTAAGLVNGSRGVVVAFLSKARALQEAREYLGAAQLADAALACAKTPAVQVVPVVRFVNGRELAVTPALFVQQILGRGECRRVQLPLKLAWTVTIHKSQGLTLDAVQVSLSGMFVPGQAYVALSRARTLSGLEILDWDRRVVPPDEGVREFYASLEASEPAPSGAWDAFCIRRWGRPGVTARELLDMRRAT